MPKKKIMSQGVGPSRLHRDPHAPDPYAHLRGLHVGGKPVEELPEEMVAKLSYDHTDEGIEERNRGKVANAARETVTRFDKSVQERRDFRRTQTEPWEARDPMKEILDEHVPPGFRGKFLSPMKTDREGTRGFEVVKDQHGDPVKLGRMPLGIMPVERVQKRNAYYAGLGADRLKRITENAEELQRAVRAGDDRPFRSLGGDALDSADSLYSPREEVADPRKE